MNEKEMSTLTGIIADPEKNVYSLATYRDKYEIDRIIRIFRLAEKQRIYHKMLSIRKLATFRLVMSNN
ncbi:MAG: hypothetical protein ACI4CY_07820 [Candidatus Gastranaerophilaceae bacterium]